MSFSENVNAVTRFIRTILVASTVGAIGYAGGWLYTHYSPNVRLKQTQRELLQTQTALQDAQQQLQRQGEQIAHLSQTVRERDLRIEKLATSIKLLKVDRRVAEIVVLRQEHDRTSGELLTDFRFQETTKEGQPLAEPKVFRIVGDLLYVDYWIVKFDDVYIERAELDRSTSICLFRRLFGEFQEPHQGYTLDEVGSLPAAYGRQEQMTEFERQIWHDFWNLASDPQRAALMGIRAAHGEAVAIKLRPGKRYQITLRASDGLSVSPPEDIFAPRVGGSA